MQKKCSYTSWCLLSPPFSIWAVMVAIGTRRERQTDSAGGNGWRGFISPGLTSTMPNQCSQHKETQVGWKIPDHHCAFSCMRRTSSCCFSTIPYFVSLCLLLEHGGRAEESSSRPPAQAGSPAGGPRHSGRWVRWIWVFPPSTEVFIPNRNSLKRAEEDWTANYRHCVPTGCHPCLLANRIVFR